MGIHNLFHRIHFRVNWYNTITFKGDIEMVVKVNGKEIKNVEDMSVMEKDAFVREVIELGEKHSGLKISCNQVSTALATASTILSTTELSNVGKNIREILEPVIELFASLGYPTTYVMLIVGFLFIATGRKTKGIEIIKWSCIGYVGISFAPFILSLLDTIARAMREGLVQ